MPNYNFPRPKEYYSKILSETLSRFISLRQDFTDEIPDEISKPEHDPKYEVRKSRVGFFTEIKDLISGLLRSQLINEPVLIEKCEEFLGFVKNANWSEQNRIKKEDIEKANRILDILIQNLSKQNG